MTNQRKILFAVLAAASAFAAWLWWRNTRGAAALTDSDSAAPAPTSSPVTGQLANNGVANLAATSSGTTATAAELAAQAAAAQRTAAEAKADARAAGQAQDKADAKAASDARAKDKADAKAEAAAKAAAKVKARTDAVAAAQAKRDAAAAAQAAKVKAAADAKADARDAAAAKAAADAEARALARAARAPIPAAPGIYTGEESGGRGAAVTRGRGRESAGASQMVTQAAPPSMSADAIRAQLTVANERIRSQL